MTDPDIAADQPILYVIISYNDPAQVLRLATMLSRGSGARSQVLVHHDPTHQPLPSGWGAGLDKVQVLPDARPVLWGHFSQVEAFCRCVEHALTRGVAFEWLVLLSGHDYPIKPMREIEAHLASSDVDGFLPDIEYVMPADVARRYAFRHVQLPGGRRLRDRVQRPLPRPRRIHGWLTRPHRLFNVAVTPSTVPPRVHLGWRPRAQPFDVGRPCRISPEWFMLRRRSVQRIMQAYEDDERLVDHFRHTFIPTEAFYATILLNDGELTFADTTLRYNRWTTDGSAHPVTLGIDDLPAMLASPDLFARKLDLAHDPRLIDALDEHITSGS